MALEIESDRESPPHDRFTKNIHLLPSNCTRKQPKTLTDTHLKDLESSGLSREQIEKTGHFSADKVEVEKLVGYKLPGLILSYCDPSGKPYLRSDGTPFYRVKPDWGALRTKETPKYLSSKDEGCRPYFSTLYPDWEKAIKSTRIDLWETEGEKKGDCGCACNLAVIAFAGVDAWVDRCSRESKGELKESRVLPELSEIDWKNRRVYQCFDSDIIEKIPVQLALAKRAHVLKNQGAHPYLVLLPNEIDGSKNGLDDFFVRHGIEALEALRKEAEPTSFRLVNDGEREIAYLTLKEPESHYKAVMSWAVLKETWAFRAGIGWYEWQSTHWMLKTQDEFEVVLTRFMDAQSWKKRTSGLITSIVRELRSRLLVAEKSWNPFGRIAFSNGTLDLNTETFMQSHNPYDQITRLCPYAFAPSAKCPIWLDFLNVAMQGDSKRIDLIQAIFRYAVLPRYRDRKAEIEKSFGFVGRKGTGKGTVLEVLSNLVGNENVGSASPKIFKDPIGLGQLLDKDVAIKWDASGYLSDTGNYNKVVSNEPVVVKKLFRDTCTTRLGVVVIRAYNKFIPVPDGSEGLDRRLTIIPFNHRPETSDTGLSEKLKAEIPGIFAWCCSIPADEMKRRILSAGEIEAVAEVSIERFEANNPEFGFLCEAFPEGGEHVKAGDLYRSYQEWCRENQYQPKSMVKFRPAIEVIDCKRSKGKINGCYYYTIPKMSGFDVASHLGIVKRQSGDSCRDGSNLEP